MLWKIKILYLQSLMLCLIDLDYVIINIKDYRLARYLFKIFIIIAW